MVATGAGPERSLLMTVVRKRIVGGPTKADLLWALGDYPARHLQIHFDGAVDSVTAHIDAINVLGDGTQLRLTGHLVSGRYQGWLFHCAYDPATRSGMLRARAPEPELSSLSLA